jgi:hypothetical protein
MFFPPFFLQFYEKIGLIIFNQKSKIKIKIGLVHLKTILIKEAWKF